VRVSAKCGRLNARTECCRPPDVLFQAGDLLTPGFWLLTPFDEQGARPPKIPA
jgi:hypothetical protein